jgi:hypothetical protein
MSRLATGVLGVIAISLSCGAVQFALGRDLSAGPVDPAGTSATSVNRAGKADRAAGIAHSGVPTQTILLRLQGLSDMSVLVRVPVANAARNRAFARSLMKPGNGKMTLACEPVVSVLTEIAGQLQPGRCVT